MFMCSGYLLCSYSSFSVVFYCTYHLHHLHHNFVTFECSKLGGSNESFKFSSCPLAWHISIVRVDLNWSIQVSEICKKARLQVSILYRKSAYPSANTSSLLQLYLAYIHPHLEYAAPVLDPYQQGLINFLERVQKFALKAYMYTKNWSSGYECLLQLCNLSNLARVYETVPTLSNCQWTTKFLYCTHCTMTPVQISQKH